MGDFWTDTAPDDVIDVAVCVFADGQTFWTHDANECVNIGKAWRSTLTPERAAELEAAGALNSVIQIRMMFKDYRAIGRGEPINTPLMMAYVAQQPPQQEGES